MNEDQKRSILTVFLCFIIFFLWQNFFGPKELDIQSNDLTNVEKINPSKQQNSISNTSVNTFSKNLNNKSNSKTKTNDLNIKKFTLNNMKNILVIDNYLKIYDYSTVFSSRPFKSLFVDDSSFFLTTTINNPYSKIYFNFKKINNNTLEGYSNNLKLILTLDDKGFLLGNVSSLNNPNSLNSLAFNIKNNKISKETSFLSRDLSSISQYLFFGKDDVDRFELDDSESLIDNLKWFGADTGYHFFGVIFDNKYTSNISISSNGISVKPSLNSNNFNFKLSFLKKEYDNLLNLGDNLELSVDFGFFSILAVPILRGLQYCHDKLIPNYGVAIILLTFLMRLITFPLQYKSFKSMKKMQMIQPELTKLKEKFKDDPQTMQAESMKLFKKSGANPLGGCLPLLLQMPVFFAFYKVLYASVELVGAPFYFWIYDLSIKDPYYILPGLMTFSIFLQQKLTPTASVDPTQQKVMMFMPLVLGLVMKDLPAGLCLYMFVSTILGIFQQLFVYKSVK
jgi:YidC/Oxa1 family membrane protein insertase